LSLNNGFHRAAEQIAGMTYAEIIELSKASAVEIERVPGR
jgi:hypothetical protein